jgi:hypothetical protein
VAVICAHLRLSIGAVFSLLLCADRLSFNPDSAGDLDGGTF